MGNPSPYLHLRRNISRSWKHTAPSLRSQPRAVRSIPRRMAVSSSVRVEQFLVLFALPSPRNKATWIACYQEFRARWRRTRVECKAVLEIWVSWLFVESCRKWRFVAVPTSNAWTVCCSRTRRQGFCVALFQLILPRLFCRSFAVAAVMQSSKTTRRLDCWRLPRLRKFDVHTGPVLCSTILTLGPACRGVTQFFILAPSQNQMSEAFCDQKFAFPCGATS